MNIKNDDIYWLIVVGIAVYVVGFSDYRLGYTDQVIKTSEHDEQAMILTYDEQVKAHNKVNVEQLPKFNKSYTSLSEIASLQRYTLNSLIGLKNEGTLDFSIYHAAVANTNSPQGFAWFRLVAYNAVTRENALQEKAKGIKAEAPYVYAGIIVLLIANIIRERRRKENE